MPFPHVTEALKQRTEKGLLRQLITAEVGSARQICVDDRTYINFANNDYLGLAQHPKVIEAWQQGARTYGVGSGGSQLVTGYSRAHQQLSEQLCELTGCESALLFSSGFAANSGVLTSVLRKGDTIFQDRLNHASLIDGAQASPAVMKRFRHNDQADLQRLLAQTTEGYRLIVTEGVFSMDGDQAPLSSLQALAAQHDGGLMIDDAHGLGITETCAEMRARRLNVDIYMATFGKAMGVGGAFVACEQAVADYLINFCRHYIYTTAIPPAQAVAISAALDISAQGSQQEKLHANIARFRAGAAELKLALAESQSAIQPIIVGRAEAALCMSEQLRQQGFWVTAIRPPTVPVNTARLRVTLSASHQTGDIDRLLDALATCGSADRV